MKEVLKGKHFADVEEVKPKPAEALKGFKSEFEEFISCFEQWEKCLGRCTVSNREYFAGD